MRILIAGQSVLMAVLISAGVLWATAPVGAAPPRPNVVFILVDDLRADALSCTGHPVSQTPHIDRLAREGALFRNAFVTTPLCSPARASFLTGQYVHTHGVLGNGDSAALSHRLATFPRLLHDAGYETAYIGKWHMGNDDSPRPGFDRWVSFRGQGLYNDPPLNIDGQVVQAQGYMTDILSDHAVEFVSKPHDRPFLLYLAHKAVHGPFTPAERHRELYAGEPIPPPPADSLAGKPVLRREVPARKAAVKKAPGKKAAARKAQAPNPSAEDSVARNQLRCLRSIDDGVGRILEALKAAGTLDNTLVIFTSDNGYFWGEHGLGDKRFAYEESIRIPLLMRLPGLIKPGTTIEAPALNIDIAPTLLDLAALEVPQALHGRSLVPLLHGEAVEGRDALLFEYFAEPGFPRTPTWSAVRTDRWKYIRYADLDGMDELYDLQADPHELTNRITDPGLKPVATQLQAELERLQAATR